MKQFLKAIFFCRPMPRFRYCSPDQALFVELRKPGLAKMKCTNDTVILIGCHYSTDLGDYVYWTVPLPETVGGELVGPFPVAQKYLEKIQ